MASSAQHTVRTAIHNAATTSISNIPLVPSSVIQRASPRIASVLTSLSNANPSRQREKDEQDVFSPYFRPDGRPLSPAQENDANNAINSNATRIPLSSVTQAEIREWQTPHMPLLTPRQLELALLEIRRRYRQRQLRLQRLAQKPTIEQRNKAMSTTKRAETCKQQASVLVPLCTVGGVPSVLLTRRSASLSSHASQISFPGGYYDAQLDRGSLRHTALREMQEELCYRLHDAVAAHHIAHFDIFGEAPSHEEFINTNSDAIHGQSNSESKTHFHYPFVTILGQTQPVPSMSGSKVTPIIGAINYDLPPNDAPSFRTLFPGNPHEVDRIFTLSLSYLLRSETSEPLQRWSKDDQTDVKSPGGKHEIWGPVFPIPGKDGDKVWGLTATVLRPLLHKVFRPVFGEKGLDVLEKNRHKSGVSKL